MTARSLNFHDFEVISMQACAESMRLSIRLAEPDTGSEIEIQLKGVSHLHIGNWSVQNVVMNAYVFDGTSREDTFGRACELLDVDPSKLEGRRLLYLDPSIGAEIAAMTLEVIAPDH